MLLPPPRVVAYGVKAAMASNIYIFTQKGASKSANGTQSTRPLRFLTTMDFCTVAAVRQLSAPQTPPHDLDIHQLSQFSPPSPLLHQTPPSIVNSKERVVLLITCPLDPLMTGVFSTLGVDMERKTPALDKWNQASPPRVSEHLRFAVHMSIFIVDARIWNDRSLSFKEKFKAGKFWDHQGPRGIRRRPKQGTAGIPWSDYDISSIEAVEQLGTSTLSDREIRKKLFDPLFQKWKYLPVWWNCQDFAVRLGYLLTANKSSKELNNILISIKQIMKQEVIGQRRKWIFGARNFVAVTSVGIALLPIAVPSLGVAVPIGITGAVGAECMSGIIAGVYHIIDWKRGQMWAESMQQVEEDFEELKVLHVGLDRACEDFTTGKNVVKRFQDLPAVHSTMRVVKLVRRLHLVGGEFLDLNNLKVGLP